MFYSANGSYNNKNITENFEALVFNLNNSQEIKEIIEKKIDLKIERILNDIIKPQVEELEQLIKNHSDSMNTKNDQFTTTLENIKKNLDDVMSNRTLMNARLGNAEYAINNNNNVNNPE